MTALHVFDMDGTLLRGTTAAIEISRRIDRLEPLAELERGFAAEEISAGRLRRARCTSCGRSSPPSWSTRSSPTRHGSTGSRPSAPTSASAASARCSSPCRPTSSPSTSPSAASTWSTRRSGRRRRSPPPIDPAGHPQPRRQGPPHRGRAHRSRPASQRLRGLRGLDVRLPLFAVLQNTVAVNADAALERAARLAYRGADLRVAYAHGRALLDAAAPDRADAGR